MSRLRGGPDRNFNADGFDFPVPQREAALPIRVAADADGTAAGPHTAYGTCPLAGESVGAKRAGPFRKLSL